MLIRHVFSFVCRVEMNIRASAPAIWRFLTDAQGFPRWNSTLHVPGTERTFTPRVSAVTPNQRMTWTGGFAPVFKGVRTFALRPRSDG